jgi:hypothetical protein
MHCLFSYLVLWPCLVFKKFQDFSSHRMFGHMHRVLNVDEKKTNYIVLVKNHETNLLSLKLKCASGSMVLAHLT